jgi:hypothetical protein
MQTKKDKQSATKTTDSNGKDLKAGKKAGPNQQAANKKAQKKGDTKAENVERNMDTDQE